MKKRTVEQLIDQTEEFFDNEDIESFINSENELIFIPEINAYFRLEDVKTEEDFLTKVVAYLSYYCAQNHYDEEYSPIMERYISFILNKDFNKEDLFEMYKTISNSLEWSRKFVRKHCPTKMFKKWEKRNRLKEVND